MHLLNLYTNILLIQDKPNKTDNLVNILSLIVFIRKCINSVIHSREKTPKKTFIDNE